MILWFVLVEYVLPAGMLGVLAGRFTTVVLRQDWSNKTAALDFIFASVVIAISIVLGSVIFGSRTDVSFSEAFGVLFTISTASVVVRHIILLTFRSSGPATSA